MSTKELEKNMRKLSDEVALLRSFAIGLVGEIDSEGRYKPEFIKKIRTIAHNSNGVVRFTTTQSLLKKIRKI